MGRKMVSFRMDEDLLGELETAIRLRRIKTGNPDWNKTQYLEEALRNQIREDVYHGRIV